MERPVQEGPRPGRVDSFHFQGDGRQHRTDDEAQGIELEHRVVERPERPVREGHEYQAEMDGRQIHEHDREHGDEFRPEMADGQVPRGETARRAHAERMVDRIERGHPGQQITDEGQRTDAQVHPGEDEHRLVGPGTVVVPRQGGQFHIGQTQAHRRRVRNDQEQEHDDAQAADEMRRRAPEQETPRQRFNVLQDGGARGRKAGNALEPGIYQRERTAPQCIRKHAEHEGQEPRQEDDHVAVPESDPIRPPHEDEREHAHGKRQRKTDQERCQGAVSPVREGHEDRQQHEQRTHQERRSHIPRYDLQVHSAFLGWVSFSSLIRRRNCRFSSASSVMPSLSSASWSSPSKAFSYFRPMDR